MYSQTISPRHTNAEITRKTSETTAFLCCRRATLTPIRRPTSVYARANSTHSVAYDIVTDGVLRGGGSGTHHDGLSGDSHGGAYATSLRKSEKYQWLRPDLASYPKALLRRTWKEETRHKQHRRINQGSTSYIQRTSCSDTRQMPVVLEQRGKSPPKLKPHASEHRVSSPNTTPAANKNLRGVLACQPGTTPNEQRVRLKTMTDS